MHIFFSQCLLTGIIGFDFRNAFMFVTTTNQTLESCTQQNDKMIDITQRRQNGAIRPASPIIHLRGRRSIALPIGEL
jgi:hypothetical protein